jgi:tRNA/rRNA methyltransferase
MKTMGLSNLYLVSPKQFPDKEATALATNAADLLETAHVCSNLEEALTGCTLVIGLSARKRQLSHELLSSRQAVLEAVRTIGNDEGNSQQQIALLFGTEMSGLSNAELDLCQLLAMIPTNPDFSSLNVAAAVQVMCYEIRMALLDEHAPLAQLPNNQIKPQADKAVEWASIDEVEGMYQHMESTLINIGFLKPKTPGRIMQRLRRMYARARLEKEEVRILRGIFKLMQSPRPPEA